MSGERPVRERLSVRKTYKLWIGGAFVRSESGRYDEAGGFNFPRASRKDVRDAVAAARKAAGLWAARTAYNRGQILYRLAEVMESRREELHASLVRGGADQDAAARELSTAIDRAVYYAGFCDKYQSLVASANPVAGPHFGFSVPEPMGVVAVVAPEQPVLLGLVSTVLPVIAGGNTCVVVAGTADPRTAVVWCECLATSDLPGGVVNVLTGDAAEMAPHLAKHREVIAMDLWGLPAKVAAELAKSGADNVKRVTVRSEKDLAALADEDRGQGLGYVEKWLEMKTVWHPAGI